jgi:hypothetical protein
MGKFSIEIPIPYGPEQASARIMAWLQSEEGRHYAVLHNYPLQISFKRDNGVMSDIYFAIKMTQTSLFLESWIESMGQQEPIKKSAFIGGVPTKRGWNAYTSLRKYLEIDNQLLM